MPSLNALIVLILLLFGFLSGLVGVVVFWLVLFCLRNSEQPGSRAGAQTFGVKFFDCRGALRISFIVQLSKIDAPKGWGGSRLGCPRRR